MFREVHELIAKKIRNSEIKTFHVYENDFYGDVKFPCVVVRVLLSAPNPTCLFNGNVTISVCTRGERNTQDIMMAMDEVLYLFHDKTYIMDDKNLVCNFFFVSSDIIRKDEAWVGTLEFSLNVRER